MNEDATSPKVVVVHIKLPPPRTPTILEGMILLRLLRSYLHVDPGGNLMDHQLEGMPPEVNAYWLWIQLRDGVV